MKYFIDGFRIARNPLQDDVEEGRSVYWHAVLVDQVKDRTPDVVAAVGVWKTNLNYNNIQYALYIIITLVYQVNDRTPDLVAAVAKKIVKKCE